MKKTKNKVIKIRVMPIILLVLVAIVLSTLVCTNTMEQMGLRINKNNTIREVQVGDVAKLSRDGREYGFSTLEEAIEEAKDKETIEILDNVTIENEVTINKSIIIKGSDYTITTKGITNTGELDLQNVTITDVETQETIALNNSGKLNLKSVTVSNANGTGIKNTGTLVFKNSLSTITAKNAIDGKINEIPSTYGLKINKVSNDQQIATIISEADAISSEYELLCENIFYKMDEILDRNTDKENILLKSDVFNNGSIIIKILKNIYADYDTPLKIQSGETVNIDLNNLKFELNHNSDTNSIYNCGTLNIKNGSLRKSKYFDNIIINDGELKLSNVLFANNDASYDIADIHKNNGTINIEGTCNVNIDNSSTGICNIEGEFTGKLTNSGTMNIISGKVDGEITNDKNATMNIGKKNVSNDKLNIIVSSESPYFTNNKSPYFTNNGTLNINSGTITADYDKSTAIKNSGNIIMHDGNITAKSIGINSFDDTISSVNDTCYSIMTIEKGKIQATDPTGTAIYESRPLKEINIGIDDKRVERQRVSIIGGNSSESSIGGYGIYTALSKVKINFLDGSITGNRTHQYKENINTDTDKYAYYTTNYEVKEIDNGETKTLILSDKMAPTVAVDIDTNKTSDKSVTLNIKATDDGDGVDKFKVYYRAKTSSTQLDTGDIAWTESEDNINKYELNGLNPNTTYSIKVEVFDKNENKTESAELETTTLASSIPVTGISLNKNSTTIKEGTTETLTATVMPENATNRNVTWTSSNVNVVKVNNGVLTAIAEGTATITATTEDGGKTATCQVTIVGKSAGTKIIESINIKSEPTKTTYLKGEEIDLTGGMITITYDDDTTKDVEITKDMITGYSKNELKEQTITVTYGGKTATFTVTVKNDITGIEIKNKPTKITYKKGEDIELAGGMITVIYENGDTEEVKMDNPHVSITGYSKNEAKEQTITVTYGGKTATFKVTVKNDVTGIVIKNKPTKTSYLKGEELDITGGMITVTYQDTTTSDIPIAKNMITGYDKNTLGEQVITVTYEGKTTTFKVTVKNDVIDVVIVNIPNQIVYEKGKDLDLTGGKVRVVYENGDTQELDMKSSDISVTGYDANKLGEQTITVKYGGKTATFKVTVKAASASNGNGNSSTNGNNNNNNSNSNKNQQSATKKDNTTANIILPKTGIGKIMLGIIVLLTVGGVTYIRFRKLKDVK